MQNHYDRLGYTGAEGLAGTAAAAITTITTITAPTATIVNIIVILSLWERYGWGRDCLVSALLEQELPWQCTVTSR